MGPGRHPPTARATVAVVHHYLAAREARDLEAMLAVCRADCCWESVAVPGPVRGLRALASFYASLFEALPTLSLVAAGEACSEEVCAVWGRLRARAESEFMGLRATGRHLDVPIASLYEVRSGLLAREVHYFDAATVAAQVAGEGEAARRGPGAHRHARRSAPP